MPFKNRSFSTLKYSTVFILMLLLLNIAVIAQSPKDRKRGKKLLGRGCAAGDAWGCARDRELGAAK